MNDTCQYQREEHECEAGQSEIHAVAMYNIGVASVEKRLVTDRVKVGVRCSAANTRKESESGVDPLEVTSVIVSS